ncbi:hypothetical protein L195_g035134, partial [Trifolium pratense]
MKEIHEYLPSFSLPPTPTTRTGLPWSPSNGSREKVWFEQLLHWELFVIDEGSVISNQ